MGSYVEAMPRNAFVETSRSNLGPAGISLEIASTKRCA